MKLVAAITAMIMVLPVHILCYLDDILVLSSSPIQAAWDIALVISIFQWHGFSINQQKSYLRPPHLYSPPGSRDRLGQRIGLPVSRSTVQHQGHVGAGAISDVPSHSASVPATWEDDLVHCDHALGSQALSSPTVVSAAVPEDGMQEFLNQSGAHLSLTWRGSSVLLKGCMFLEPNHLVLTSDVSLQGWGAHLLDQVAQGLWSLEEQVNSINWLELRAVRLAFRHFQDNMQ